MKKLLSAISLSILASSTVQAGPFGDQLARCMVENTSGSEKVLFAKWVYAGMSKHPDVASMSTISDGQAIRFSQLTADLVTEIMTKRCKKEARQAFQYEQDKAFDAAFGMLGEVAMQELMTNPKVNKHMFGLGEYLDPDAFKGLE